MINASLFELIREAIRTLESEGKIKEPLPMEVPWPIAPPEAMKRMETNMRAMLVFQVVEPLFREDLGPMVLELFQQGDDFEIEVFHHEIVGEEPRQYESYLFTKRGPLRRLYVLEGRTHNPKRGQAPVHEIGVSLVELLTKADSPMDFHQKLWHFLGATTNQILHGKPRRRS